MLFRRIWTWEVIETGWASGSELADKVWKLFERFIPESKRIKVATSLAELFKNYDCDTLYECEFAREYVEEYKEEEQKRM